MIQKTVKITNKGMISIPAILRKKFNLKDGDYIIIGENEDGPLINKSHFHIVKIFDK